MKHVVRVIAHWALLVHIYISMAGFTLALLFGATGLTLNHQDFGLSDPKMSHSEVAIDKSLVERRNSIAHGNYLLIDSAGFGELLSEVLSMMRLFCNQIDNSALMKTYRLIPGS